jgi:hypothetical protein
VHKLHETIAEIIGHVFNSFCSHTANTHTPTRAHKHKHTQTRSDMLTGKQRHTHAQKMHKRSVKNDSTRFSSFCFFSFFSELFAKRKGNLGREKNTPSLHFPGSVISVPVSPAPSCTCMVCLSPRPEYVVTCSFFFPPRKIHFRNKENFACVVSFALTLCLKTLLVSGQCRDESCRTRHSAYWCASLPSMHHIFFRVAIFFSVVWETGRLRERARGYCHTH